MPEGWQWDETLYLGSAPYYEQCRLPYAPGLADRLAGVLALDGRGRLIDVGCGPGILTLALAHLFEEVVGVDPDQGMLEVAEDRAADMGIGNVQWLRARAEDLPAGLGTFRVATFAQSFHWMDRARVAAIMFTMLEPGGAFVHVSDVKEGEGTSIDGIPYPSPPHAEISSLVRKYLGPIRRAGQGMLRHGTPDGEARVLTAAGFDGPVRILVPAGKILVRTADAVVAWVYSRSDSAPHLFGDRAAQFEADLREVLYNVSPSGFFAERQPDTEVSVFHKPQR
jgi:SAM-dependent methyltransferase